MLIKTPYTGTRLGLGDVDLVQPLNLQHPLMRGVQGFWLPLPHLSGGNRLHDLSPYARHATLTNMDPATSWGSGPVTPGVQTSGADGERITQPLGSVPLGVSAWTLLLYWIPLFTSNDENGIWSNRTIDNTGFFQITERNSGAMRAVVERDGETLVNAGTILQENVPNMIALKANGTILTIYHNGKLINTQTSSAALSISASSPSQLGAYFDFSDGRSHEGLYLAAQTSKRALSDRDIHSWYDQARRGFPDLLNRRPSMTVVDMAVAPPPGDTIEATADPSLAADYAATLQPTPVTLAVTADLTLAQDYAATIGTQPGAIQATADASLSADYAALLQPQPVTLAATPDASQAADYAGAIQPTPVTLTASSDLSLGADYAATITEVDAPVVLQASADLSLGADYAASVVAVPVTISIGFDAGLGADFAAFLSDSSASQTVKARISTGERFTSNTSTSERVA